MTKGQHCEVEAMLVTLNITPEILNSFY